MYITDILGESQNIYITDISRVCHDIYIAEIVSLSLYVYYRHCQRPPE